MVDISNDDARERRERRKTLARQGASSAKKAKRPGVNYDFSSVMTMCSTNKVNLKNSWSLDLIDHIDDVLDQHQGSFQTASRTLQASVQIYEKRVDSTHQDTFKMLENVNRTRVGAANDAEESRETRRKGGNTSMSTFLESNLSNITFQGAVEREYEVDPLFRKMSKTFDAGGARGLLLNHLRVHNGPRVIFDTSETMAFPTDVNKKANSESPDKSVQDEDKNREELDDEGMEDARAEETTEEENTEEGINPALDSFITLDMAVEHSNTSPVCPSLELLHRNLRALGDEPVAIDMDGELEEEALEASRNEEAAASRINKAQAAITSPSLAGAYSDEDDGFVYENEWMNDEPMADDFEEEDGFGGSEATPAWSSTSAVDDETARGYTKNGTQGRREVHEEIDFTQFDAYSFFKNDSANARNANWAGPSYWRFGRKRDAPQGTRTRAPRVSKKAFWVDFDAPEWTAPVGPDEGEEEEEEPVPEQVARPATISLSKKTQQAARASDLPQDLHYTIQDLCKLFLKPVVISEILQRGGRRTSGQGVSENASQADDHDAGYFDNFDGADLDMGGTDGGFGGGADDYDDDYGENDFVQPSHVLEKIHVDYARKAKRVDVKKLKDTIWTEIEDQHESAPDNTEISFSKSVEHLAPKIANNQVTVPFYFISLLHLANENNLEIQGVDDLSDLFINASAAMEH